MAVLALAIGLAYSVWRFEPAIPGGAGRALLLLTVLAIVGEAWQFVLPRSASASIAFIPYSAMVLVVPSWIVLPAIGASKIIEAVFVRRATVKSVFNFAQFIVIFSCSIWTYRMLGGTAFLPAFGEHALSFAQMTGKNGVAGLMSFCVAFALNMLLVCTVIAIHTERPFYAIWRENHLPGLGLELLAAPVVFLFAWMYVSWGPIAAALIWVPILGYRHTIKTTLALEQTNRELLELMIKSIEARDPYTSGHSRRVQQYAILIARALKLGEKEVEHVGTAALLHDVGKIYEKYGEILSKEEKLSPDEWALMREHPIDGANLVSTMSRLQAYVPAVRHHHENWDGTGYPDGLAGDRIPLASRIIMFADTVDAMTTARPYRGPLGEDIVRSEIVRRRGEQFDPAIADAILSSPIWRQLFVPTHPASRGHEIALSVSRTDEFVLAGKNMARSIVGRR